MQKEFRTISKKAREALQYSEGIYFEFKSDPKALKDSTLVAFANSPSGGMILAGIDENTNSEGLQRGIIKGCNVTDKQKQIIMNKASDCIPPIKLDIFTENISKKPFFRIEIPPGKHKPYCTKSGLYLIREDGRNRALHPDELLAIFLSKEGERFLSGFKRSVNLLEDNVISSIKFLQTNINSYLLNLQSNVRTLCSIGRQTPDKDTEFWGWIFGFKPNF
jgi:ATP-dependent DNA helicase RecG